MIFTVVTVLASALLAVQAAPAIDRRSFNPPNFVTQSNCQSDGPVTVCAFNKGFKFNFPRLKITYASSGELWNQGSPISAFVQVNENFGTFGPFAADQVFNGAPSASVAIGDAKDVQVCYHATVSDKPTFPENSPVSRCPVNDQFPLAQGDPEQGSIDYFYNPPSQKDLDLVRPNDDKAWDVQIAVTNAQGNWDSKNGQNYKFKF
ncbi:hypothetical protein HDU97_001907 [Phlyctochytrium planicorne]|nr:hypothetical protein HDU97_001907 [Phlyctochytrium planicorne]